MSHANGSVNGLMSLSGLLDDLIVSEDCASVMNGAPTFTRPFFRLPAHSSVGGMSRGFVKCSKCSRLDTVCLLSLTCKNVLGRLRERSASCAERKKIVADFISLWRTLLVCGGLY